MAFISYHEQTRSRQGSGKNIAKIGIIIITYGGLHPCIKNAEKRKHNKHNRQKNAQVTYRPSQPAIGEKIVVFYTVAR